MNGLKRPFSHHDPFIPQPIPRQVQMLQPTYSKKRPSFPTLPLFSNLLCIYPEPVLVNVRFLVGNGEKKAFAHRGPPLQYRSNGVGGQQPPPAALPGRRGGAGA